MDRQLFAELNSLYGRTAGKLNAQVGLQCKIASHGEAPRFPLRIYQYR